MLISVMLYSQTKELPYKKVQCWKLKLPIDMALWPLKHMYASYCRLPVGAKNNMLRTMAKAASLGGEGESISGLCEKIFGYPCR